MAATPSIQWLRKGGEIIKCDLLPERGKGYPNYNYILANWSIFKNENNGNYTFFMEWSAKEFHLLKAVLR